MFRKTLLALYCVAMLVLGSGAAPALAKGSFTTLKKVYTPPSPTAEMYALYEFQSALYLSVSDGVNGGQIIRSKDGNTWEPVTGPGFGINSNYKYSWGMTEFKGNLYVSANCYPMQGPDCPGVVLRSANGKNWEQIPLATGESLLDKLGVFDGMIYATSVWSGGQIWRSRSGNPGTWEAVKDFNLGDHYGSSAPVEFKDQVFLTASTGGDSVFILRSADGRHWNTSSLKITDQDPSMGLVGDESLKVFNGNLYLCVTDSLDGGAIYRSKDGKNWEKVVSGNPAIFGYRDMQKYDGDLYATSFGFDGTNFGVQLWRSHSGSPGSWELVNLVPADWGANSGSQRGTMAVLKGRLYLANNGGSVFQINSH